MNLNNMKTHTKASLVLCILALCFLVFGFKYYQAGERSFNNAADLAKTAHETAEIIHNIGYEAAKRGENKLESFKEVETKLIK